MSVPKFVRNSFRVWLQLFNALENSVINILHGFIYTFKRWAHEWHTLIAASMTLSSYLWSHYDVNLSRDSLSVAHHVGECISQTCEKTRLNIHIWTIFERIYFCFYKVYCYNFSSMQRLWHQTIESYPICNIAHFFQPSQQLKSQCFQNIVL